MLLNHFMRRALFAQRRRTLCAEPYTPLRRGAEAYRTQTLRFYLGCEEVCAEALHMNGYLERGKR